MPQVDIKCPILLSDTQVVNIPILRWLSLGFCVDVVRVSIVPREEPALSKFRRVFRRFGVQRRLPKTGRQTPPASG